MALSVAAEPGIPAEAGAFVKRFGGVVEHSPWVAERAFAAAPFAGLDDLHAAFESALLAGSREEQLDVLRAHPDLAVAGGRQQLTAASASEQAGAGLERLEAQRRDALAARLTAYRERFGFPFIACVRDHGGAGLAELLEARIDGDPETELATALAEVSRIARHRLADLLPGATR